MSLQCPAWVNGIDPALCTAVDHYCERTSSGIDAEPLNFISNLSFIFAAALASYLLNRVPDAVPKRQLHVLVYLVALVGLGSMLFHALGNRWSEWGDVIPIILFLGLYLWIAFSHFFTLSITMRIVLLVLVVGSTFYAEAFVPGEVLWGGALYVPVILTLVVIGFVLLFSQPVAGGGVLVATAVFVVSLVARSLDSVVCPSLSVGTHFLWHICNAIVLYVLTAIAIVHARIARSG